jgi:N-carbamoyl-L-amino-acid hydrolase
MKNRLQHDFDQVSRFGALPCGGVTRIAFTTEDLQARNWLKLQMEKAGLTVSIDPVGNMRGRRAGTCDLPPVMMGSHLDTVPQGGNYDGVIGVLAALEVIRRLNDKNLMTRRPVEVINFSAEESSRFGVGTLGSKAMTGKIDLKTAKTLVDKEGISLYQALKSSSFPADEMNSALVLPGQIHGFVEMHIEQGPVLESRKGSVGIVTAIAAPTRFKIIIKGRSDHSGSTPMGMRRDALAGASELILGVERIAGQETGKSTVGTVGYCFVTPGSMNVVPGQVELGIDIRDTHPRDKENAVSAVKTLMDQIAEKRGLTIVCDQLCNDTPVTLSEKMILTLKEAAHKTHQACILLPSGAGHDAMNMAQITAVGMIFIPCLGGISHNTAEYAQMKDIEAGTRVLLETIIQLAQE